VEAGYSTLRRPIGNDVSPLWEWLPATIPFSQALLAVASLSRYVK